MGLFDGFRGKNTAAGKEEEKPVAEVARKRTFMGSSDFFKEMKAQVEQGPHDSEYLNAEDVMIYQVKHADGQDAMLVRIPDRVLEEVKSWYDPNIIGSVPYGRNQYDARFRAKDGDFAIFDKQSPKGALITRENAEWRFPSIRGEGKSRYMAPAALVGAMDGEEAYRFKMMTASSRDGQRELDVYAGYRPGSSDQVMVRGNDGKVCKLSGDDSFGVVWIGGHPESAALVPDIGSYKDYEEDEFIGYAFDAVPRGLFHEDIERLLGKGHDQIHIRQYLDSIAEGIDTFNMIHNLPPREDRNGELAIERSDLIRIGIRQRLGEEFCRNEKAGELSIALSTMGETARFPEGVKLRYAEMKPVAGEARRVLVEIPEDLSRTESTDNPQKQKKGDFTLYTLRYDDRGSPEVELAHLSREFVRDNHLKAFRLFADEELDGRMGDSIAKVLADKEKLPGFKQISRERYAVLIPEDIKLRDRSGVFEGPGTVLEFHVDDYLKTPSYRELATKAIVTIPNKWDDHMGCYYEGAVFTDDDMEILRDASARFMEKRREENGLEETREPAGLEPLPERKVTKTMEIMHSQMKARTEEHGPNVKGGI